MAKLDDPRRWQGQWAWHHKHVPLPWNQYVYFLRHVELPASPRRAIVRITADARYTLFVNGHRLHFGPARSFPQYQSYDTLDLAPHLRSGANTIAVIVHQFGVSTFQSVYRDVSGLLVDGVIELDGAPELPLHTPGSWKCRVALGWRKDVARYSVMLGFQEHFDADADPPDWMNADYQPSEEAGWREPLVVVPAFGHPWLDMEERGIPLLASHSESFASVVSQFQGENARGYKIAADVYHLPQSEKAEKQKGLLEAPDAMLRDDASVTTIPPPPEGEFVMAVLDLAEYRTGHIQLDIAEASGDEILDILYVEDLDKRQYPILLGEPGKPTWCMEAVADRYRCRAGAQQWEAFHFKGMRYVALIFRNVHKPLKIRRVSIRQVHATLEDLGAFECSDPLLNQIWNVARRTQQNCLFDAFVDCPWREQGQYWGDARVQSRVTLHAFGDVSILARGIRQMAQSQSSIGALHAHPPADTNATWIVDFMLTWILSVWDHYSFTGEPVIAQQYFGTLRRVLEFFQTHESPEGLIGGFDGYWFFLDWQPLYRGDHSAVLNLMYLMALRKAAELAKLINEPVAAGAWSEKAERLAAIIEMRFWNADKKHWVDGYDAAKGEPIDETSQHVHALAILANLKPETHASLARDFLVKPAKSKRTKVVLGSPFFYAYILEAAIQAGEREAAIEIIRDKWGDMIERGATTFWEIWNATVESRCHAWSASPLYHLSQQVLGVMPIEPGYRRVRINPFIGKLEFARGTVPTPAGLVRVEWETAGDDQLAVRIELPKGVTGEFVSGTAAARQLPSGNSEFHT